MKKTAVQFWAILFIAITLINAAGILLDVYSIHLITKPLLMPAILLLLLLNNKMPADRSLIIAGLLFSWLGDVLLLFESKGTLFFIGGLASFLITHICYIIYFTRVRSTAPSLIRQQPWIVGLIAGYGVSLVMFLLPHLAELKIPVMLYAIVICNMLIFSLHVFTRLNKPSNFLFVAGAILFTASDSMLAINKFHKPFTGAGVLIMLTYCTAQFCIVQAVIKRNDLKAV